MISCFYFKCCHVKQRVSGEEGPTNKHPEAAHHSLRGETWWPLTQMLHLTLQSFLFTSFTVVLFQHIHKHSLSFSAKDWHALPILTSLCAGGRWVGMLLRVSHLEGKRTKLLSFIWWILSRTASSGKCPHRAGGRQLVDQGVCIITCATKDSSYTQLTHTVAWDHTIIRLAHCHS